MSAKTIAEFVAATGREPVQDDMERVNCADAGRIGHFACGWCRLSASPRKAVAIAGGAPGAETTAGQIAIAASGIAAIWISLRGIWRTTPSAGRGTASRAQSACALGAVKPFILSAAVRTTTRQQSDIDTTMDNRNAARLNAAISATLVLVIPSAAAALLFGIGWLLLEYGRPWMFAVVFLVPLAAFVWGCVYRQEMRDLPKGKGTEWLTRKQ